MKAIDSETQRTAYDELYEKAITEAFWKLLEKKPIDKITVTEICERIEISRNTFYYHFANVYDVVEELFRDEETRLASASTDIATIEQGLREATRLAFENQRTMRRLHESAERDRLMRHLHRIAQVTHGITCRITSSRHGCDSGGH